VKVDFDDIMNDEACKVLIVDDNFCSKEDAVE
jgi:hypothetical protein